MLGELTERQREVFEFVAHGAAKGMPPTVREIGRKLDMRSPNGVRQHLRALERKGWIVVDFCRDRGLRLTEAAKDTRRIPVLDLATITRLARTGKW